LINADMTPVSPAHFEEVSRVEQGSSARNVKIGGKWGRVASDGSWLLEPRFDHLSKGIDLFIAALDGKRGFMRSDGSWLIEPKFDAARLRDAETAFVSVSGSTGVLRLTDQSWMVQPRPGVMCDAPNLIISQTEGKRVILSPTGETWIELDADRIGIGLDLGLLSFLRHGKWGLVDTTGQVVVEPTFDELGSFAENLRGITWAKSSGRWCAIDRRGRIVTSIACMEANPMPGTRGTFLCTVEP
jgi:hypothetical protein